jgi:hypothetical protein
MVALVEFVITIDPPGLGATPWACARVERQAVMANSANSAATFRIDGVGVWE